MMTYKYFLSLGSNIEPCLLFLNKACVSLNSIGKIIQKSSIYKTQAWGEKNQPNFLNAVIEFKTDLEPNNLLINIKRIENSIGRTSSARWGPRKIDIDIIFCRECNLDGPDLQIPHKKFAERRFVLAPLAEIQKHLYIKSTKRTVTDLLNRCPDQSYIQKLATNW
jgi:2-amino-4-hydroxy-6-hydroxymethyldihydropteridine diphosphokinase